MMMSTQRRIHATAMGLVLAVLIVLAAACASADVSSTAVSEAEPTATVLPATTEPEVDPEDESPESPAVTQEDEAPEQESNAEVTQEQAAADEVAEQPAEAPAGPVLLPGLDIIVQVTPSSGNGTRPLLAWEPVDGAEFYSLALYAPDGQPYWGSLVSETETFVGGPIQINEDKPGPRVIEGMTWSVVGLDAEMVPVASSPIRPIAP